MEEFSQLTSLAKMIRLLEPDWTEASLNILAHERQSEMTAALLAGLGTDVRVQSSSGEYSNQLAIVKVAGNRYLLARDYRDVYIGEVNYCTCRITAGAHGVLVYHIDYPGVIYDVSRILAENQLNISKLNVSREQKGKNALLISLTDEQIDPQVIAALNHLPNVTRVLPLPTVV
ncbi:ACT domain-containing protein [Brevibacillus fulvus]|uniref:L-serine dehydratase n=1 Tax=Brevibacillus fulvus TaxID=1125967 RepID=A0A938XSC8_9BACL|nr:ACT domain-containing protein [Brevibacillus fulvus]MBM7589057.1 L-serine dehydratase [Brevibacillus fulvus]